MLESLCFGVRSIIDQLAASGAPIERVILTSGLSRSNVLLRDETAHHREHKTRPRKLVRESILTRKFQCSSAVD